MPDRITAPGKFEGQLSYVPYLWEQGLDGGPDYENGKAWGFKITASDVAQFPALKVGEVIWLIEDDQGFVKEI